MNQLAFALAASVFSAQLPPADFEALKHDTQVLSSDAFEGRMPGTAGEQKTIDLLISRMRAIGLQPGNRGSWTQDVPLVSITPTAVPPPLRFVGGGGSVELAYGKDAVWWTRQPHKKVELDGSAVVFVGHGIRAPERGWDDYAGADVRGKTVLILGNEPDWQKPLGKGPFGGKAITYYGMSWYKLEEAARQGAAAAILVFQPVGSLAPWPTVLTGNQGTKMDLVTSPGGRVTLEAWIDEVAAKRMFALAGQSFESWRSPPGTLTSEPGLSAFAFRGA